MTDPETASQPNLPEVKSFEARRNILLVQFEDGHKMITHRNTGGWSPTDAIETFALQLGEHEVAKYQSPYQYPRNTDSRNGFVALQPDYTPARVAEYWASADSYIRALVDEAGGLAELSSRNESAYNAFVLLSHGHQDLVYVASDQVEVHVS